MHVAADTNPSCHNGGIHPWEPFFPPPRGDVGSAAPHRPNACAIFVTDVINSGASSLQKCDLSEDVPGWLH